MKKNNLSKSIHIILGICAAFGWWGLLYPELAMTPSTYNVVYADEAVQAQENVIEWDFDNDMYWKILEADSSQIRFRSRLLMNINVLQEQGRGNHDSAK